MNTQLNEFIEQASSHLILDDPTAFSIEGRGQQAIVIASDKTLYKIFAKCTNPSTGLSPSFKESVALRAIGAYVGNYIKTPELRAYKEFKTALEMFGKTFVGAIEQSRLTGVKPNPQNPYQYADIGNAMAELHQHLAAHKDGLAELDQNIIWRRMNILREKHNLGAALPPKLRKKIIAESSKLALDATDASTGIYVHGDFHTGNMLFDGEKYGIFDFATVGKSIPEQDMTALVNKDPSLLKGLFAAYTKSTGYKPQKSKVMTLHCLDLAIAAEQAHLSFKPEQREFYLNMLEARLS